MWSEQKDALKKRLADTEVENMVSNYHLPMGSFYRIQH